jgi:hypothetical protein
VPGQGIVDFRRVFRRLAERGYAGPFTLDFGTAEERASWRDTFAGWLAEARIDLFVTNDERLSRKIVPDVGSIVSLERAFI